MLSPAGDCNMDPHADSYTAFCIVQVGGQIEETRLLCDIMPGTADIEFEDALNLWVFLNALLSKFCFF